jgi:hypothetical protein
VHILSVIGLIPFGSSIAEKKRAAGGVACGSFPIKNSGYEPQAELLKK